MTLRGQDPQSNAQRGPERERGRRRWRFCGGEGAALAVSSEGAAGRLSRSLAWPPGCLVTTARPWNAAVHKELLGLRGHSDLITTLKS